jgi:hypothetical protein
MGSRRIIALDLGKFKTVACMMNAVDRSHVFETIEMSPTAVHDLLTRHATDPAEDTLVVFETCDCCGWVCDLCVALGLPANARRAFTRCSPPLHSRTAVNTAGTSSICTAVD